MDNFENYIVRIPGNREIALPSNNKALLCALDKAMDNITYEIVGKSKEDLDFDNLTTDHFSTYVLFEIAKRTDGITVEEKIREQVSNACSLEILESTDDYQLVIIDQSGFCIR